jgi:hypothetical protein
MHVRMCTCVHVCTYVYKCACVLMTFFRTLWGTHTHAHIRQQVRKFVSLLFSVFYFGNPFSRTHWLGTGCVFAGIVFYTWGRIQSTAVANTAEATNATDGATDDDDGAVRESGDGATPSKKKKKSSKTNNYGWQAREKKRGSNKKKSSKKQDAGVSRTGLRRSSRNRRTA